MLRDRHKGLNRRDGQPTFDGVQAIRTLSRSADRVKRPRDALQPPLREDLLSLRALGGQDEEVALSIAGNEVARPEHFNLTRAGRRSGSPPRRSGHGSCLVAHAGFYFYDLLNNFRGLLGEAHAQQLAIAALQRIALGGS